jgi:hypothetical protein
MPKPAPNANKNTPQAKPDTASTNEDTAINIPVLANDLGGNAKHLYSVDQTTQFGATVTRNADGTVTYDPSNSSQLQALTEGQTADDTFRYTMQLGNGVKSTATVTVHVTGDNDSVYKFTAVNVPGAIYTTASGINDSGTIVGRYGDGTGGHGFVDDNGTFTTVDVPGATYSTASGINDSGTIVGNYYDSRTDVYGFEASATSKPTASASVTLSHLLTSQAGQISMSDLLPGSAAISGQSAQGLGSSGRFDDTSTPSAGALGFIDTTNLAMQPLFGGNI